MPPPRHASFVQTQWTLVRRAADEQASGFQMALGQLCQNCWHPIDAFIRRSGKLAEDAEDLCQDFFERVIRTRLLASADPEKGKLRTFLLSCLKHYMADEHDRASAQKRGGGRVVEFSALSAEEQYLAEPADTATPDRLYQRQWALQIIATAMQDVESAYSANETTGRHHIEKAEEEEKQESRSMKTLPHSRTTLFIRAQRNHSAFIMCGGASSADYHRLVHR